MRTESRHVPVKLGRLGRLSRRVVLPLTLLALLAALAVTGFSRLTGAPATAERPFGWEDSSVYIAGGDTSGTYTTCVVAPERGQRRVVEVPGSSGGLTLEPWFEGGAKIFCDRSVLVTTGWQSTLYPHTSGRPLLLGLAALAIMAWWFGRMPRERLPVRDPHCGRSVEPWPNATPPAVHRRLSTPWWSRGWRRGASPGAREG